MEIFSTKLGFADLRSKNFFKRLYDRVFEEDIFNIAAQVAFYFIFSLFPLLLFLISLSGFVLGSAEGLSKELFLYLEQVMPTSAYDLVKSTIEAVTENSGGGKITLGIFVALWSASAGFDSIRNGLNRVYNLKEHRPYWKTKLQSLLFTLSIAVLIMFTLAIVIYGFQLLSYVFASLGLPELPSFILFFLQIFIVFILLMTVFGVIYTYTPAHEDAGWVWVTPGAVIGIILWVLFSLGFRTYLSYFNSYNETYGSLGAVIILLLWLYITALVILTGGVINSILENISADRLENEEESDNAETSQQEDIS